MASGSTLLTTAPFALLNGYGFQWPAHICAASDRASVHCFFQPLSHCGASAQLVCPSSDASCAHSWQHAWHDRIATWLRHSWLQWLSPFPFRLEQHVVQGYHVRCMAAAARAPST